MGGLHRDVAFAFSTSLDYGLFMCTKEKTTTALVLTGFVPIDTLELDASV